MIYTHEMIKDENNKKIKKQNIINNIITVILLILIIVLAYFFYQRFIYSESNINFFGYHAFVVLTGSMEPNINPGDIVLTKKTNLNDLKIGDVITFYSDNNVASTTTHRIVNITNIDGKTYFETKGDNNSSNDSDLVPYENVLGSMSFKISKIGKIIMGISSSGIIAIVLIALLIRWSINCRKQDKITIRENSRKHYNFPKYIRKKMNQGVFDAKQ